MEKIMIDPLLVKYAKIGLMYATHQYSKLFNDAYLDETMLKADFNNQIKRKGEIEHIERLIKKLESQWSSL